MRQQTKCIELERRMTDAIHYWCKACKELGLSKDDIETKMIEAAARATDNFIELSR